MGIIQTITEGGQISAHRFRMFRQVAKATLASSFSVMLVVFILKMISLPYINYQGAWYYSKGYLLQHLVTHVEVEPSFWEKIAKQKYTNSHARIPPKTLQKVSEPCFFILVGALYNAFLQALLFGMIAFWTTLALFLAFGRKSKSKQHISGKKISSPRWLAFKLRCTGNASTIKIATVPLVKGTESQHMLITGGTGTGKTNCLHHILKQIRSQKQKAIIIDTTGVFLDRYYRPENDFILSPFHPNSAEWSPWAECKNSFDYAGIAEAFIPHSYHEHENYWRVASRTLFCSLLQKFDNTKKSSELTRWLLFEPLEQLCSLVKGTKAASHMDINSEKTASSIRSVASTFLECMESLKDTTNPFSIHDWIANENQDSWLFLHCTPLQRTAARPLLSAWISSAIKGLLAINSDLNRKIWFIIDEFPSLQRIKDIEVLLTEGRKYGGCGILSLQGPSQLECIYGRETTKTIIGNTLTKIIFAEQDPEIAEKISRSFGEHEVKEYHEGISYGAHESRDGVNLSTHVKQTSIISPTQILSLQKNTAFIKLPGSYPITKVHLKICK